MCGEAAIELSVGPNLGCSTIAHFTLSNLVQWGLLDVGIASQLRSDFMG